MVRLRCLLADPLRSRLGSTVRVECNTHSVGRTLYVLNQHGKCYCKWVKLGIWRENWLPYLNVVLLHPNADETASSHIVLHGLQLRCWFRKWWQALNAVLAPSLYVQYTPPLSPIPSPPHQRAAPNMARVVTAGAVGLSIALFPSPPSPTWAPHVSEQAADIMSTSSADTS